MLYNWVRAFHIIFVIAFMASLMIYPRYKIHQLSSKPGEPMFETMKKASDQLRKIIMNPSLIFIWLLGGAMLYLNQGLLAQPWMHVKLLLVFILSGFHGYYVRVGKQIDRGETRVTAKKLRMLNEVPFLMMIAVVIFAVVEPF